MNLADFIADPLLLGPYFSGSSWRRWKAVLRAAEGLPLSPAERELFAEVAGARAPPAAPVNEIVALVGRGGGKDAIASAAAVHAAVSVDRDRLRPGERAVVLCLAVDREQARIAFNYTKGYFEDVPLLAAMVERMTADTIDLTNGAQIVVSTNTFRGVRGRTVCLAIYDECCFWNDDNYASPDVEVDAAIGPGLARSPGSKKWLISSVYSRKRLAYEKWRRASFGQDDADTLVVLGTTQQFNSTFDAKIIERDLARDYERFSAEYLSRWRDDLVAYIDREALEACVTPGCYERGRLTGAAYQAFVDVSGGRGDSFMWAIGHTEPDGRGVCDLVREITPPFSPDSATAECAASLRLYGVSIVVGDRYAGEWPAERFREHGITYVASEKVRSDIYRDFLPLVNAGRVDLLDSARAINQICNLERRVQRSGKDSIGHPAGVGHHDDLANPLRLPGAGDGRLRAYGVGNTSWLMA